MCSSNFNIYTLGDYCIGGLFGLCCCKKTERQYSYTIELMGCCKRAYWKFEQTKKFRYLFGKEFFQKFIKEEIVLVAE